MVERLGLRSGECGSQRFDQRAVLSWIYGAGVQEESVALDAGDDRRLVGSQAAGHDLGRASWPRGYREEAGGVGWPRIFAASALGSLPLIGLFLGAQRYLVGGLTFSGMKQ